MGLSLMVLAFLLLVAVVAWLLLRGGHVADVVLAEVAPVAPVERYTLPVAEAPKPKPAPRLTLRLVSEKGRKLKEITIEAKSRRSSLTHRTKDGKKGVFQARHKEGDTWIYQRVSVERE
jgi:hypothetical protein